MSIQTLDLGNVVGPQGPQGPAGADGQDGRDGRDGPTTDDVIEALFDSGKINDEPTEDSDNLVKSGGVRKAIDDAVGHAEIDFMESVLLQVFRKETDADTRDFFAANATVVAVRNCNTVTLFVQRDPAGSAVKENYKYNFSGNVSGHDHHNFGAFIPDGWRPVATAFAYATVVDTAGNEHQAQVSIFPNGSIGFSKMFRLSDNAAVTTAYLDGLRFTATYACKEAES